MTTPSMTMLMTRDSTSNHNDDAINNDDACYDHNDDVSDDADDAASSTQGKYSSR
jgi:hypothetical protein